MLNLITNDITDRKLLENSFNAFKNKEHVVIVTESKEKQAVYQQIVENMSIPQSLGFSFQNLFELKNKERIFYIAQCLIDFGYPVGNKGGQTFDHKYYYQIVGFANFAVDLGNTHLRPETKLDKLFSRFFFSDITLEGSVRFNEKYFLTSDKREEVERFFDKQLSETIAKYDDLLINIKENKLFLVFDQPFNVNQTRIAQDVLMGFVKSE